MKNILLVLITLLFSSTLYAEGRNLLADYPYVKLDSDEGINQFKESFVRNQSISPGMVITVCENDKNWCNGYFTAVIHNLQRKNVKFCLPVNKVGRQVDEGIWSIIKSWLYRQPNEIKITFSNAVLSALTEHVQC